MTQIRTVKKNDENLLVYEMDFIAGESLDHCLYKLNSEQIKFFAKKLGKIIETISKNQVQCKIDECNFIVQKFNESITELKNKHFSTRLGKELFDEYSKKIENLEINKKNFRIKATFCHVNLALYNLLISKKNKFILLNLFNIILYIYFWIIFNFFQILLNICI